MFNEESVENWWSSVEENLDRERERRVEVVSSIASNGRVRNRGDEVEEVFENFNVEENKLLGFYKAIRTSFIEFEEWPDCLCN